MQLVFEPVWTEKSVKQMNELIRKKASASVVGANPYDWMIDLSKVSLMRKEQNSTSSGCMKATTDF